MASVTCLLDDKQVGGEAIEPAPTPCERYCDRVAACFDEDEPLCRQWCPQAAVEDACRDAQLSVIACLDPLSCDGSDEPSAVCAEVLQARDEGCTASE